MAYLNRWDPFTEIARLQDEMTRHIGTGERRDGGFVPPVDIFEAKDGIVVQAELPGVKADDLEITVENNVLTLAGKRRFALDERREGLRRVERAYGTFTRSFALPSNVQGAEVSADLSEGVLTVKVPKRAEAQPRRVAVTSGQSDRK